MSYEVTATRKRPRDFESMVGQEFVVSTLKNSIKQKRIAHAYLFSGPRGVGKTTAARILAKALNCVHGPTDSPCGECDNCRAITNGNSLDVIEIDGASNTGVNDVRTIKEEILFPPTSSPYKIYIIDEVHMLSQSAFNALLKTIEEPPEYVVFIFATTETQKVPATIRSRCQQFNFHLISSEIISSQLEKAAVEMGVEFEKSALNWISKEATGSMRDAYTLFDQVVSFSDGKITMSGIKDKLGLTGQDTLNRIMKNLLDEDVPSALDELNKLIACGESIEQIIKDFTEYFRTLLLLKHGVVSENILDISPSEFPHDVRDAYNTEQIEAALDMLFDTYRNLKFSIDPVCELQFVLSRFSHLKYVASNSTVMKALSDLKSSLNSESGALFVQSEVNRCVGKVDSGLRKESVYEVKNSTETDAGADIDIKADKVKSDKEKSDEVKADEGKTDGEKADGDKTDIYELAKKMFKGVEVKQ